MALSTDEKIDFVINLIPLFLAALRGVKEAADFLEKSYAALKDGVSPEELAALIKERDDTLQNIIDQTEGSAPAA